MLQSKKAPSRNPSVAKSAADRAALLRQASFEALENRQMFSVAYALAGTAGTVLDKFDTTAPATVTSALSVTGLQTGERLDGIAFRPKTNELYAIGVVDDPGPTSSGRLYKINTTTGAATIVGAGPFSTTLADGARFDIDFNPVADAIRVVDNLDDNFRLDATTGAILGPDTTLDNTAGSEDITGIAYDNVDKSPITATTLFGIDSVTNNLIRIGGVNGTPSPNTGAVTVIGSLGVVTSSTDTSMSTAPDGTVYATLQVGGITRLYSVNTSTGAATAVGTIGSGADVIRGLALDLTAVAKAPDALNDTYTTANSTALVVNAATGVLANDTDPTPLPLTAINFTQPANGTVVGNANGSFTYTPNPVFVGTDTFTYQASNGTYTTTAQVTITVTAPNYTMYGLVGSSTLVTFKGNTPNTITASVPVAGLQTGERLLGIDFRPSNGDLVGVGSSGRLYVINPTTGSTTSVLLSADPADATSPFSGLSGVEYGIDFNPTVDRLRVVTNTGQNLRINPDNGFVTTDGALNSGTTSADAAAYANSVNGATSTTLYVIDPSTDSLYIQNPPNNGTETLVGPLGVDIVTSTGFDIGQDGRAYLAGVSAVDGLSRLYTVDLATGTATAVNLVGNGAPPLNGLAIKLLSAGAVANNDAYLATEDTPLNVAAPGLLSNDTDADGSTLTINSFTQPSFGTLVLNANGSFTYTPNANFNGVDSFTYKAFDGTSNSFKSAFVTITVQAVNDVPVSVDDSYTAVNNATLNISAPGLLANDTDADGDTLRVGTYTQPAHGTVTVNNNGSFSYTATAGYVGPDSFTYRSADAVSFGNTATVNINVVNGQRSLSVNDVSITEGNSGTKTLVFTVSLDQASANTVTVGYSTGNQTASSGSDYQGTSGYLTFLPGQTTKLVSVPIFGDTLYEGNEILRLGLFSATNATIARGTGFGTIFNDDGVPTISINNVSSTESNSGSKAFTFTVTLNKASSLSTTVNYATSNGTAIAGSDFTTANGTLTFAAGQTSKTITVFVKGDTSKESNETFFVTLTSPVGGTLGSAFKGTGTIVNDD